MARYRATFNTTISLAVEVDVDLPEGVDPDDGYADEKAAEAAWRKAEDYLQTLRPAPSFDVVSVDATLDGIGADEVIEVTEP